MKRFPLTLPPIEEVRLEARTAPEERSGLCLNPPISVKSLCWRWYAFPSTGEVFCAARVRVDFRLSLPGASAEGQAGDYVASTLDEVWLLSCAEISAGTVLLAPLIAQKKHRP